jgi:hypothetical protein
MSVSIKRNLPPSLQIDQFLATKRISSDCQYTVGETVRLVKAIGETGGETVYSYGKAPPQVRAVINMVSQIVELETEDQKNAAGVESFVARVVKPGGAVVIDDPSPMIHSRHIVVLPAPRSKSDLWTNPDGTGCDSTSGSDEVIVFRIPSAAIAAAPGAASLTKPVIVRCNSVLSVTGKGAGGLSVSVDNDKEFLISGRREIVKKAPYLRTVVIVDALRNRESMQKIFEELTSKMQSVQGLVDKVRESQKEKGEEDFNE